jgi:O-antigen/teichoic acid export membrane protein
MNKRSQKLVIWNRLISIRRSSMTVDVVSRYLTTIFSFISFVLLFRIMDIRDFAIFQVAYSLAAIAIWIGDFGLGTNLITNFARKDIKSVNQIWTLRLLTIAAVVSAFLFLSEQISSTFQSLFFLTAILDLLSDSHLNLRQVAASKFFDFLIQPIKRGFQSFALMILFLINPENPNSYILITIAIPSILLVLVDSRRFGASKTENIKKHYSDSSVRWFHSCGLVITNLDNLILSLSSHFNVIAILALTKKLFNFLGIIGTALFPRVLAEVTSSGKFEYKVFKNILTTILLISIPNLFVVLFLPYFISNLWGEKLTANQLLMSRTLLFLLPFNLFCLAFNSVMLGLNLNTQATVSTLISGLVYLGTLSFSRFSFDAYVVVSIALVLNIFVWLCVQIFFLRNATNFEFKKMINRFIREART